MVSQDNTATPSGRILIVADDMMMRELMKDALVRDDYIIEEVDNGLDALAAVRNSEPDMILLDVKMPGMSGFEVCSEIRTNLNMQGISVVMVTDLEDSESIEKAFSLGATAFINKPINSITFRYQIQYLLKARNAFVELKEREIHLEYMERISRILAQSKNRDAILQEALDEMLDIFSADRVFIISSLDAASSEPEASYEALSTGHTSIRGKESAFINEMEQGLLHQAEISEFPLVTSPPDNSLGSFQVHNQMMKKSPLVHEVVVDGFETFEYSQYFPIHHHVAVDKETDFFLYFSDSELRRKGRMTEAQKHRRHELEMRLGRPDPKAIENAKIEMPDLLDQIAFEEDPYAAADGAHAIALLTEWKEYKELDYQRIYDSMAKPAFIFDGRNMLDHNALFEIGFEVYSIGKRLKTHLK